MPSRANEDDHYLARTDSLVDGIDEIFPHTNVGYIHEDTPHTKTRLQVIVNPSDRPF
jgi:hypothetical protein